MSYRAVKTACRYDVPFRRYFGASTASRRASRQRARAMFTSELGSHTISIASDKLTIRVSLALSSNQLGQRASKLASSLGSKQLLEGERACSRLTSEGEPRLFRESVATCNLASRQQWGSEQGADSSWTGPMVISNSELHVFEIVSYCSHLDKWWAESEQVYLHNFGYYSKVILVIS